MIELPDDELDKLFRKSAEEPDPYFDPNDWNDLKNRLDAADGIRSGGWLHKWWPLGVVLLFIAGGLTGYLVIDNKDARYSDTGIKAASGSKADGVGEKEKPESENRNEVAKRLKESGQNENPEKSALTKSNIGKILPLSRSKAGGVFLEPNRSRGKVGEGAFSSNVRKKVSEIGLQQERIDKSVSRSGDVNVASGNAMGNESTSGVDPMVVKTNFPRLSNAEKLIHRPFTFSADFQLPPVEVEPSMPDAIVPVDIAPAFAIRFGYAPDLSSVGLKNFSKPGASVSLLAEYQVMKRLYVQSGLIWSNKIYGADSADYNIPKRAHYYGPKAISAQGVCKVFELPVNLRYDFSQGKNSRWFAGTGVSSYHMNEETYTYQFENEQDPQITENDRGWKGSTGWWWFSHLNASAGYEYRISKQLSLMAEPYVRIPIRGVGYGKVKLVTSGVWLSVRYTPFHK